jgi:LacI family transcriptional regulator
MKRATMRDVALRAGVSKTTVSHVINETRKVDPSTRGRVLDAITALGYYPNMRARSLTTDQTSIIGMVISDPSNYFFGEIMKGIGDVLLPEQYGLIVCTTHESLEREQEYLKLLLKQRVDGIIAAATSQRWEQLYQADHQHIPLVFVDRCLEDMDRPYVGVENQRGAYLGVRHLIECGHPTIGLLAGHDRLSTMRERQAGYEQAIREAGLPERKEWIVPSALSIEDGCRAMRELMSAPLPPRAVFINNNLLALGALLALCDLGLRCPEDVAIACFDDHPWAAVSNPPLTVVRQPARQLGREAATMLLALIHGEPNVETRISLPCQLVVRHSSIVECPAAGTLTT